MSDTPRTDAEELKIHGGMLPDGADGVTAEEDCCARMILLARTLERELEACQKECDRHFNEKRALQNDARVVARHDPTPEGLRDWLANAIEDMEERAESDGEPEAACAFNQAAKFIRETEINRPPASSSQVAIPNESIPALRFILHVLRNPHGWSEDDIRAARLGAADIIEARAGDAPKMGMPEMGMSDDAERWRKFCGLMAFGDAIVMDSRGDKTPVDIDYIHQLTELVDSGSALHAKAGREDDARCVGASPSGVARPATIADEANPGICKGSEGRQC